MNFELFWFDQKSQSVIVHNSLNTELQRGVKWYTMVPVKGYGTVFMVTEEGRGWNGKAWVRSCTGANWSGAITGTTRKANDAFSYSEAQLNNTVWRVLIHMTPKRCVNYEDEERQRIPASHCLYCNIHSTQPGLLTSESSKTEVNSWLIKEH